MGCWVITSGSRHIRQRHFIKCVFIKPSKTFDFFLTATRLETKTKTAYTDTPVTYGFSANRLAFERRRRRVARECVPNVWSFYIFEIREQYIVIDCRPLIPFSFVFRVAESQDEFFGSVVGRVGGDGGGREKAEPGKGDQLHEAVPGPAQPRAEKALGQSVHGRLESLRQGRWVARAKNELQ